MFGKMLNLTMILLLGVTAATQVEAQDFLLPGMDNSLSFNIDEEFYISCPPTTTSKSLSEVGERVICIDGTLVRVATTGNILDLDDLKCKKKLPSYITNTNLPCYDKGTLLFASSFDIYQQFTIAYWICFDKINLTPLHVTFDSMARMSFMHEFGHSDENDFVASALLYGDIDMDGLYIYQKDIFNGMGLSQYINDSIYLIPGQLVPRHLFAYRLKANATLDYANVVPKWNVHENDWEGIIDFWLEDVFIVPLYDIGTTGVATLRNDVGVEVELYLSNGKVPVPRWLWWKVQDVEHIFTFWGYNNPYFNVTEVEEEFREMCDLQGLVVYEFYQWYEMLVARTS